MKAVAVVDNFYIQEFIYNDIYNEGGSGYGNGAWYYHHVVGQHAGWNQWFDNAPYGSDRWKVIDLSFDVTRLWEGEHITTGSLSAGYMWSTPAWSALGLNRPPDPETEHEYVVHSPYFFSQTFGGDVIHVEDHFVISEYNPEWVAVFLSGANYDLSNGLIDHRCVPEPGSLMLLGSCLLGVAGYTRRKFQQ